MKLNFFSQKEDFILKIQLFSASGLLFFIHLNMDTYLFSYKIFGEKLKKQAICVIF